MADKGLISRSIVQGFADEVRRLTGVETTGTPAEVLGWLKEYEGGGGPLFGDYNGVYYVQEITSNGITYNVYTLTSSGTLKLVNEASVWLCGGGGNGRGNSYTLYGGGAGAYCVSSMLPKGVYTVSVGGATGATTIISEDGTITITANPGASSVGSTGASGGTGGGGGGSSSGGTGGKGDGISKYPFGLTELGCHCAGGGAGGGITSSGSIKGGNGGTNGSDGSKGTYSDVVSGSFSGGSGGTKGGGAGGGGSSNPYARDGADATFYGGGGGSGGAAYSYLLQGAGGSGYQGVVYILEEVS